MDEALAGLRIQETRLLARREELLGILRDGRTRAAREPVGPTAQGRAGAEAQGQAGAPARGQADAAGQGQGGAAAQGQAGAARQGQGSAAGQGPVGVGAAGPYSGAGGEGRTREVSAGAVQNVLLVLGGLLLTVAAVVFTVVSWGRLGIGGRAGVLAGFTALAMLAPAVLVRRGLTATAETVAGFTVALLLLDGYAARRVGFLGADAVEVLDYTAGVLGVVALILVVYARVVPLRGPVPVAVVLAQPVLPLLAGDASATWVLAMLVATAALDVALVRYVRAGYERARYVRAGYERAGYVRAGYVRAGYERAGYVRAGYGRAGYGPVWTTAVLCGSAVATLALLGGAPYALDAGSVGQALGRSAPLAGLVLLGAFVAWSLAGRDKTEGQVLASLVTVGTTLALIAALAAPAKSALGMLSLDWSPLAYLVPALVVVLAATWLPWRGVRSAGMVTGGLVALLTALTLLPWVVVTLAAPLAWFDTLWTGTWDGGLWPTGVTSPVDVVALGVLAACLLVPAVRGTGGWPVKAAVIGALASGALMVAVAPDALAMAYPAAVAVQVALVAVPAVSATLGRTPWWAVACALTAGLASVEAAAYAFGGRTATLIALPILAVAAAAVALAARVTALRMWGLGVAVLFLGLEAVAVGLAVGLQVRVAASVGCAVAGVLLLGRSLWAGRSGRDGLRYTGTALLLLASWLRLWAGEVTVVEAYTVPCSLVLLGFGWWRRRSTHVSSWAAYGAGLSSTMLPSLVAVYADTEWRRSMVLGVLALAVLLAGARFRLQAPTMIGGVVLAGVAVRELAPYVSEMLLAVPRWVPIAVGGLLLVVLGATYEARKRDLRRLRGTLATMD
ncbi:SCO7613 C-terminal domain-containing membrane protein [Sphaerisporangium viridialbum]|uniref:SCO7613 C-terminal domain-containing membrane protein n=1 Tax=Sphaerisporangium viridialbum TaxID=46189 RepID=UPI003C757AE7